MTTKGTAYHAGLKNHKVECKCPVCDKRHKVSMTDKPEITPRVYCPRHAYRRHTYAYCG